MRAQGQNKKAAVQSLRCQFDRYNVSPIKNSFPFFNSAEALLTAAWQGGCQSVHGLYDQHRNNRGPCFFSHPLKTFWHVNKTFLWVTLFHWKKWPSMSLIFIFFFFPRENKEFYSFRILFKKNLFGSFFRIILMVIVLTQLCATWLYNAYEP